MAGRAAGEALGTVKTQPTLAQRKLSLILGQYWVNRRLGAAKADFQRGRKVWKHLLEMFIMPALMVG